MPSLLGKEKQRFTSEKVKVPCEVFDLQASTQEAIGETEADCHQDCADLEGECVLFKGKDGHDTDGSLFLGKGKASGRVDVPVGVNASLGAETFFRSGQSVALVTPGSCVVKTTFVKGVDGNTVVHRVHEHTVVGDLLDFTEDVWVTNKGKLVQLGTPLVTLVLGIMTHYAAVDGSEEERSVVVHHRLTFQVSGRVRRVGNNGCGL